MRNNRNRNNKRNDPYNGIIANENIKSKDVRVNGEIVNTRQALYEAQDQGLDLIVITENANPPVCRIMELNKYMYEQKQREKAAKKKQRESVVEQKEIRMGLNIDTGDIEVKCNNIRKNARQKM